MALRRRAVDELNQFFALSLDMLCIAGTDGGIRVLNRAASLVACNDSTGPRTISALFGFENQIITQTQYTVLVTVVILSAVVPTLIAQQFFEPDRAEAQFVPGRLTPTEPDLEVLPDTATG